MSAFREHHVYDTTQHVTPLALWGRVHARKFAAAARKRAQKKEPEEPEEPGVIATAVVQDTRVEAPHMEDVLVFPLQDGPPVEVQDTTAQTDAAFIAHLAEGAATSKVTHQTDPKKGETDGEEVCLEESVTTKTEATGSTQVESVPQTDPNNANTDSDSSHVCGAEHLCQEVAAVKTDTQANQDSADGQTVPRTESQRDKNLWVETDPPRLKCEHFLSFLRCEECLPKLPRKKAKKIYELATEERQKRKAARKERVEALNEELLKEQQEASNVTESDKSRRSRRIRYNLADLPLPIKEREFFYRDYGKSKVGMQDQWDHRLWKLRNNKEALKRELQAMAARRGCAY